jgi:hypothetical protein
VCGLAQHKTSPSTLLGAASFKRDNIIHPHPIRNSTTLNNAAFPSLSYHTQKFQSVDPPVFRGFILAATSFARLHPDRFLLTTRATRSRTQRHHGY